MDINKRTVNVVLTNRLQPGAEKTEVLQALAQLFQKTSEELAPLLQRDRTLIKKNISIDKAQRIQQYIEGAGLQCILEPVDTPSQTQYCKKCAQVFTREALLKHQGACPSCGIIVDRNLAQETRTLQGARKASQRAPQAGRQEQRSPSAQTVSESLMPTELITAIKWGVLIIGGIFCVFAGISVFTMPANEIILHKYPVLEICPEDPRSKHTPELQSHFVDYGGSIGDLNVDNACLKTFKMDLFNSGWRVMPETVVRIHDPAELTQRWTTRPVFLDFDRAPRTVRMKKDQEYTHYALGLLYPNDQVTFRARLLAPRGAAFGWDDFLATVDVARGETREGEFPKLTALLRLIVSVVHGTGVGMVKETVKGFLEPENDEQIDAVFEGMNTDIALSIDSQHSSLKHRIQITAVNKGPASAGDIVLNFSVPEVTITAYSCKYDRLTLSDLIRENTQHRSRSDLPPMCKKKTRNQIECTFPSLDPTEDVSIFIDAIAPSEGIYQYEAEVKANVPDPEQANNQALYAVSLP